MKTSSNKPDAVNPAIASRFAVVVTGAGSLIRSVSQHPSAVFVCERPDNTGDNMAQEIYEVLETLAEMVGAGACGGLIVLLFDHRLAITRGHGFGRDRFRSYADSLIQQFEAHNAASWWEFYKTTFKDFSDHADDAGSHVTCERRRREFTAACIRYPLFTNYLMDMKKSEQEKQKCISFLQDVRRYAQ